MKIINLQAENVKKLTAVDITPTENMVRITGKNGAGKSSILDCIVMALCGGKAIPEAPIKKGKNKGRILIDLGEYTITRSFTKESSYLKIEAKDGTTIKSPQKFLDTIVGNISFDPLDFLNNESKKQRDILLKLLGIDVDGIDAREKELREQRTVLGRDQTRVKAAYDGIEPPQDDLPAEEVSVKDLAVRLKEAMEKIAFVEAEVKENELLKEKAKRDLERADKLDAEIADLTERIRQMTDESIALRKSVQEKKAVYVATRDRIAGLPTIDIRKIEKEMEAVGELNEKIRKKKEWMGLKSTLGKLDRDYHALSQKISDIVAERAQLLEGKQMPVEGLSFDDNGLLYKGVPLDQASDGEKLMISLGISMAINPTLRVLRIKDGSLLDPVNREIINSMINEKDYQLWFESVGTDANVGILIEEGEIVKVDGVQVAPMQSPATPVAARASDHGNAASIFGGTPEPSDDWPAIGGNVPETKTTSEVDW